MGWNQLLIFQFQVPASGRYPTLDLDFSVSALAQCADQNRLGKFMNKSLQNTDKKECFEEVL